MNSIIRVTLSSIDASESHAELNVGYARGFRDGISHLDTLVANGRLIADDDEQV